MNKKNIRAPFSWTAKVFNFNGRSITDYDILEYREKDIKRLKKKYPDKDTFSEALRRTLLSQYWSRAEWELIITRTVEGRIILSPWCGCTDPDAASIDVTDDPTFDWSGFAEFHIAPVNGCCGIGRHGTDANHQPAHHGFQGTVDAAEGSS